MTFVEGKPFLKTLKSCLSVDIIYFPPLTVDSSRFVHLSVNDKAHRLLMNRQGYSSMYVYTLSAAHHVEHRT